MKKPTHLFGIMLLSLSAFCWVSCNDDDEKDRIEIVTMTVDSETADKVHLPPLTDTKVLDEFLKVKEGADTEWNLFELSKISGFHYLDGHQYKLEVKKTYLANPPADGSSISYDLIQILSDEQVDQTIIDVRRFYMGKCFASVTGEKLAEKDKQEIEAKIVADMSANRVYKLITTDKNALTGTVKIYIGDTKKEGTFIAERVGDNIEKYELNVEGKQYKLIFTRAVTRMSVMPQYVLLEDLTEKYKADYPDVEQAYAQQVITMMR